MRYALLNHRFCRAQSWQHLYLSPIATQQVAPKLRCLKEFTLSNESVV